MIAICPAGPPKLTNPRYSQKRSASRKPSGGGAPATAILVKNDADPPLKISSRRFQHDAIRPRTRRPRAQLPASHPARQEGPRGPFRRPGPEGHGHRSGVRQGLPGVLPPDRQRAAVALGGPRVHVLHEEAL